MVTRLHNAWFAIAALLPVLAPTGVHANALKVASYQLEPHGGVIELQGDGPLDEPWMKLNGSSVKVWFPKIDQPGRFEQGDSEQPLRSVRLRAGSGGTALLSIEIEGAGALTRDNVQLTRNGARATVRVLLPQPGAPASGTGAQPTSTAAAATAATKLATPSADPSHAAGPLAEPTEAAPPSAAPQYKGADTLASTPVSAPVPASAAAKKPTASSSASEPQLLDNRHGLSTMQLLIALTIALGGIYLGLKLLLHKRDALATQPSIQVLGSKRLGARHQFVIVRALGQDHLLSVHGGRTDRIMSAPTPAAAPARADAPASVSAAASPAREPSEGVDPVGSGMAATLRSLRSRDLFKRAAATTTGGARAADDDATPFGAELRDFVRGQETLSLPDPDAARGPRLTESEAIAGLVRLRGRSG